MKKKIKMTRIEVEKAIEEKLYEIASLLEAYCPNAELLSIAVQPDYVAAWNNYWELPEEQKIDFSKFINDEKEGE